MQDFRKALEPAYRTGNSVFVSNTQQVQERRPEILFNLSVGIFQNRFNAILGRSFTKLYDNFAWDSLPG
jgi:hypothetical protein